MERSRPKASSAGVFVFALLFFVLFDFFRGKVRTAALAGAAGGKNDLDARVAQRANGDVLEVGGVDAALDLRGELEHVLAAEAFKTRSLLLGGGVVSFGS